MAPRLYTAMRRKMRDGVEGVLAPSASCCRDFGQRPILLSLSRRFILASAMSITGVHDGLPHGTRQNIICQLITRA